MPNMGLHRVKETKNGIEQGCIDGVIYSPRDIASPQLRSHIAEVTKTNSAAEQFFDPQYYAAYNVAGGETRLGYLATCNEYKSYFRQRGRRRIGTRYNNPPRRTSRIAFVFKIG